MNKKVLYAIIAVVVVIILVVAVLEVLVAPSSAASLTVSTSSISALVGQSITYYAFISGGTPSKVVFNFGDGTTGTATHLSGNEYTVAHSYSSAGKYLVTANATVNGKYLNNLKSIDEVTVAPASVNPTIASEITLPSIITTSQIVSPGSTISLTGATLEPPTATNWTIGYYIWNFGDGSTHTNYTVFNTTSGSFMASSISHVYSTAGIYALTLGVITFNNTSYVPSNYTLNGNVYTYYPLSDLASILASGNYYNTTYVSTIVVNSAAQLLKSTVSSTNPNEIIITELAPTGTPGTFDPAINYVDDEIIVNVYETLVQYNGSSVSCFPMIASAIPTVANGGISANYLNYTFQIRSGLKFANGDPLTAWDAYISFVRALLFVNDTDTPDWIIAQDLLPSGGFAPNATSYQNVTQAITVNNATQTITFHLLRPDSAFLEYITDPEGCSILDYNWLVTHGAGITFTPAGFAAYINQGNPLYYNTYVEYNIMGSGPYMVENFIIGQSIILVPNPNYTPIPGVPGWDHKANDTIYTQWEKDSATALLIGENGVSDFIEGLPDYDYPILAKLASEGKINITSFSTLSVYAFQFNLNINETMLSTVGSGYSVPQYYFTNLDVRRAFAYAFNYTNYLERLVGNSLYGADFGNPLAGIIPKGMPGYMNDSQLQQAGAVVPTYNLTIAKQYLEESGLYNTSINIPVAIWAGDPMDFAAAQDWGATLNSIDPNIHVSGLYLEATEMVGYRVANQDPMPIFQVQWYPDYPFPSDYVIPMYQENGTFGVASDWTPQILEAMGQPAQAAEDALMNQYIAEAQSTGNATLALKYYDQAEVLGVNLTIEVYEQQMNGIWFASTLIRGIQYEENPMYGGGLALVDIYLSK